MSDVLIKGMKMPKSCDYCCFYRERQPIRNGEFSHCGITGKPKELGGCPLVEVPKHGRLIEAEKVKKFYGINPSPVFCPTILEANNV